MTVDLSGGLDVEREFVWAEQPDDPELRESVNAWLWDDDGDDLGLPRIGVEAVADQWETHELQLNLVYADGRVLQLFGVPGPVHDPTGTDGAPRVLGAGPLSFTLVEPFRRWDLHFDGLAVETTVAAQIAGELPVGGEPTVPVRLSVELEAVVPPWENGALLAEAGRVLAEQEEGGLMGGPRFEQLNRMSGTLQVGDGEPRALRGGALRIRRRGIRRLTRFWGHAWQSAVFPSGKAFGYIVYPDREDGVPTYNEGYLYDGHGALVPARVVEAPWLTRMVPRGEQLRVVLETEDGRVETILGETLVSSFAAVPITFGAFPVLGQAIVRYTWGDEVAKGMMERSTMPQLVEGVQA